MNTPADNDLYMRTVKTYDHMVGQLNERIRGLQSQLDQAHADGAVMRQSLRLSAGVLYKVYAGPEPPTWRQAQDARESCLAAIDTKCGSGLLDRYWEAVDLVILARNVHPEAGDQMSPDWAARADTLLATVKGDL